MIYTAYAAQPRRINHKPARAKLSDYIEAPPHCKGLTLFSIRIRQFLLLGHRCPAQRPHRCDTSGVCTTAAAASTGQRRLKCDSRFLALHRNPGESEPCPIGTVSIGMTARVTIRRHALRRLPAPPQRSARSLGLSPCSDRSRRSLVASVRPPPDATRNCSIVTKTL